MNLNPEVYVKDNFVYCIVSEEFAQDPASMIEITDEIAERLTALDLRLSPTTPIYALERLIHGRYILCFEFEEAA